MDVLMGPAFLLYLSEMPEDQSPRAGRRVSHLMQIVFVLMEASGSSGVLLFLLL